MHKAEFEKAMQVLTEQYNTYVRENRFVVGGVVEILLLALLRSVGIDCEACGATEQHGDVRLRKSKKLLSVKTSLRGVKSIRLINKLSGGKRKWKTATLFVIAGVGVVFGAPDMVPQECVKGGTEDAIELKQAGLRLLVNDSAHVMPMCIPHKPSKE